ncbi:MAG: TolB family protein [Anaerolineales bacterium]
MHASRAFLPPALVLSALALAGCRPEGLRLPQSSLLSVFERQSGQIAYLGGDGNVYITDQGARRQTKLTTDARAVPDADGRIVRYDLPTWSSQDRRLAFMRVRAVQGGGLTASLLGASAGAGDPVEVFRSATDIPIYLYWSPDGEWISFLTGGIGGGALALRVVAAAGGEVSVVDTGRPYYWAWSPRERAIFAHVGGSAGDGAGKARLSFLSLDEPITEVALSQEPGMFQAPAFSPDGESLLFATDLESGAGGLMLATAAGEIRSVVAEFPGAIAFAWAPQGHKVAYIASRAPGQILPGDLYFLDLEDPENPIRIDTEAESVVAFFWAPDGERLAYLVPVIYGPEGAAAQSDIPVSQILLALYVADARGEGRKLLGTFRPTQAMLQIIPFFDQYQRSATIWSPDGNYLVISSAIGSEGEGVFVVPSSGSIDPRFLVDGRLAFWSWR